MKQLRGSIDAANSLAELEEARLSIFGKKGALAKEFAKLKEVEDKKSFAAALNEKKAELERLFEEKLALLKASELRAKAKESAFNYAYFDAKSSKGALHPVQSTMDEIIEYFVGLNFSVEDGPLIEDDFHNFQALNLPANHPARDMQDTFYFDDKRLLRTQTSPVQIRTMLRDKPPIRMIAPGAVFRRDFDITHTPMFHQVEMLVVDDKVSFANLKSMLENFLRWFFKGSDVRFRPSFFPFTEPSAEVDISCVFCRSEGKNEGCRVCKYTGFLEVMGCGVVDINVFNAVEYKNVSGYAFGLGVERFAMLKHGIPDLRSLFQGDLRLLGQFS